ncbi:hypothetical protein WG904_09950 [Pedobacter sp. Du54]|uniref:hypothetical protein n=1 Tax=Pedobacter anseongensis TaxID=3133439 RepID=UPI003094CF60
MLYFFITQPLPVSFKGVDERIIAFPLAILMIVGLTIATLPIYLNLIKSIREDITYSALSFFILPLMLSSFAMPHDAFKMAPLIAIFIGPFWLGLVANFYGYRLFIKKKLSNT